MRHDMELVTAPTAQLVTLAEAKLHLRVTHLKEDALIAAQIAAVHDALDGYEGQLGRALAPQVWRLTLDGLPAKGYARLPLLPFVSVDEITYDDAADVAQTLAPSLYKVTRDEGFGCVAIALNAAWPAMRALRIKYTAGLDPAANPKGAARIKAAMLLLIGDLYENRSAQIEGRMIFANPAVQRLLEPLRVRSWR